VDLRTEKVVVETDRHRIEGSLTLPREGFRSRLSDFVNQRDRDFFSLSDARISPLVEGGGDVQEVPFVMVARRHIRVLVPAGTG
jgi:uncharacterized protein DUF6812